MNKISKIYAFHIFLICILYSISKNYKNQIFIAKYLKFAFTTVFDILEIYYILIGLIMTTIPMTDPWMENLYNVEFNANPNKFFEKVKQLLAEDRKREKKILNLLKQYENAEISVGKIAEKLNISREEVWGLMEKHNIDLVDYDFSEDDKTIQKYLIK